MTELNPPSLPSSPEKKDTVTFNKKNIIISTLVAVLAVVIFAIAVSGNSSDEVNTDSVAVDTNPPAAPAPTTNKYDNYMDHVLNNSGKANSWNKSDIIEFGDLVCQALDEGNSVRAVVNLLNGYASTTSDVEFFASIMTGAVINICPEYKPAMSLYLNS
jgi:NADPH-dependent glutamate synthase beta subunit-like oxidoreductase